MKNTRLFKQQIITTRSLITIMIFMMGVTLSSYSQSSNNSTKPSADGIGSNKARVIHFNDDQSTNTNENFFVSYGKRDNWWNNVKLEVQTDGAVSSRHGMFTDWSHLYLVADWDNTSNGEDIIFGFDSNKRSLVKEKMRLTDEGRLGIGTNAPTQMLHVTGNTISNNVFIGNLGHGNDWAGFAHKSTASKNNYALLSHNTGAYTLINKKNTGNGYIGFRVGNQDKMVITNSGKVGIGITNPNAQLQLSNSVVNRKLVLYQMANNDHQFYGFGINNATLRYQSGSNHVFYAQDGTNKSKELFRINKDGKVKIGQSQLSSSTVSGNTLLNVSGGIKTDKVVLNIGTFPDYVFEDEYALMPIDEVAEYITENKHLPNIPSEKEIVEKGLDVRMISVKLVEKVEELTLYTIQQEEKLKSQDQLINELIKRLDRLENKGAK